MATPNYDEWVKERRLWLVRHWAGNIRRYRSNSFAFSDELRRKMLSDSFVELQKSVRYLLG